MQGPSSRRLRLYTSAHVTFRICAVADLLSLNQKEVFWYELPGTLRGLTGGDRRLYLPSGVMNQVYDTKNRVVKA